MGYARRPQRFRCGSQRGAGGDDVVDDEHGQATARLPGPERRSGQAIGSRLAGLGTAVCPIQQPPAGNTELTSDGARNGLGLVVTASAHATRAGGCPGDDIDVIEPQSANHLCCEHPGCRPAMAELQRNDQLPWHSLESKRGAYACGTAQWAVIPDLGRLQREAAAMAQVIARSSTRRAASRQHPRKQPRKDPRNNHGVISTRRV